MKEILYNYDNLTKDDIEEVVIRVKALIINSKNEITLGYCNKTYQFPGGHIEKNEESEKGLIREVKEETGIELKSISVKPFRKIIYYAKNYRNTGKNRENDIYYYIIETDEVFNMTNANLDEYEKENNYTCVIIPLDQVEEVLLNSIKDNEINEVIVHEMIDAIDDYKKIKIKEK